MFLVMDSLQHQPLWEDFFSNAPLDKYSIYGHFKTVNKNSPKWLSSHRVRSVKTAWCGEGLINATIQMLKEALKDPSNMYFSLISNTCIPLYTFTETYRKVYSNTRSRVQFDAGTIFENAEHIYGGHQWITLNRTCAKALVRLRDPSDQKAQRFLRMIRREYKKAGVDVKAGRAVITDPDAGWMGGCPDETYVINWFIDLYGPPSSPKFKSLIMNKMSTFTYWDFDKDNEHPTIFNLPLARKKKGEICGSGALYARKFDVAAANAIAMTCGRGRKPDKRRRRSKSRSRRRRSKSRSKRRRSKSRPRRRRSKSRSKRRRSKSRSRRRRSKSRSRRRRSKSRPRRRRSKSRRR